jgi:hypothetical protein
MARRKVQLESIQEIPHPDEDSLYQEINEEIDRRKHNTLEIGKFLHQAREAKSFGRWGAFKYYVVGRHRMTEREGLYLIAGYEHYLLLEKHKCLLLPTNERQVRSLSRLDEDKLKVLAWTRACKQKKNDSEPDGKDVAREVYKLLKHKPDEDADEHARAYRSEIETCGASIARARQLREKGKLNLFLVADDKTSIKMKKRIYRLLCKRSEELDEEIAVFALALAEAEEEETSDES